MKKIIMSVFSLFFFFLSAPSLLFAALPAEVSSITPANGTTLVPISMQVVVVFNTNMDATTLNGTSNIYLRRTGAGADRTPTSIVYTAATRTAVATFSGAQSLVVNSEYNIRLSRNIRTSANVRINGGTTWTGEYYFRTTPEVVPPTVTITSPANGATGIALTTLITASFSEDMDVSTLTNSNFYLNNGVSPAIIDGITYDAATRILTFKPSSSLNYGTTYTATITTGVKDLNNNNMAANKVWSFTTKPQDLTPPTVTVTSPANAATEIPLSTTVTATDRKSVV